jgi:hypothetical protein
MRVVFGLAGALAAFFFALAALPVPAATVFAVPDAAAALATLREGLLRFAGFAAGVRFPAVTDLARLTFVFAACFVLRAITVR